MRKYESNIKTSEPGWPVSWHVVSQSAAACPYLLLVGELLVLLGQDLGQVQVAHLRVDFGVFGSFLHEEAEVRSQRLLGEIWMSLNMREVKSGQRNTWIHSVTTTIAVIHVTTAGPRLMRWTRTRTRIQFSPSVSCLCTDSSQTRWRLRWAPSSSCIYGPEKQKHDSFLWSINIDQ